MTGGNHDHRNIFQPVCTLLNCPANFAAINAVIQHYIQKHQVGMQVFDEKQSIFSGNSYRCLVAFHFQNIAHYITNGRIIINNQYVFQIYLIRIKAKCKNGCKHCWKNVAKLSLIKRAFGTRGFPTSTAQPFPEA
jgi:hypothetical protein